MNQICKKKIKNGLILIIEKYNIPNMIYTVRCFMFLLISLSLVIHRAYPMIDSTEVFKGTNANLNFFPDEQLSVRSQNIHIQAPTHEQSALFQSMVDMRNNASVSLQLQENFNQFLTYLENNAHPFGQIHIDSLVLRNKTDLDAYIRIEPGPQVRIDRMDIIGNETTKDKIILRETRVRLGEFYNHHKVMQIQKRLSKLGFFKEISQAQLMLNEAGQGELILRVVEGNMNHFDGVIGYNPSRINEKGYFTGLIDISLSNFLGTGRKIEAYWEKKDIKTQQLKFNYLEPWLFDYPLYAGGSFEQLIQDTTYIKRDWKIHIHLPLSDNVSLFTEFGNEKVTPDSLGSLIWNIPSSQSWLLNLGMSYDTRSDFYNPRSGVFYQTTFEMGRKRMDPLPGSTAEVDVFNRKRLTLDIELFIPTFRWQVLSFMTGGRQVSGAGSRISLSDMYRLGGSRTLRGYREEEFWGSQIAWFNVEYRYLLSTFSRAFLFIDSGFYSRKDAMDRRIENYKMGYGVGIRLDTRLGIMGLDYGLAKGRSISDGLIHVRLVNTF